MDKPRWVRNGWFVVGSQSRDRQQASDVVFTVFVGRVITFVKIFANTRCDQKLKSLFLVLVHGALTHTAHVVVSTVLLLRFLMNHKLYQRANITFCFSQQPWWSLMWRTITGDEKEQQFLQIIKKPGACSLISSTVTELSKKNLSSRSRLSRQNYTVISRGVWGRIFGANYLNCGMMARMWRFLATATKAPLVRCDSLWRKFKLKHRSFDMVKIFIANCRWHFTFMHCSIFRDHYNHYKSTERCILLHKEPHFCCLWVQSLNFLITPLTVNIICLITWYLIWIHRQSILTGCVDQQGISCKYEDLIWWSNTMCICHQ